MSVTKNTFLPENIMRSAIHIYGMKGFDEARDYFLSLDEQQRREFWYVVSQAIDEKSKNQSYDHDILKAGYKVSGLLQCLYESRRPHYPHGKNQEHVQFALKVGDLRPDALKKFVASLTYEIGKENEKILDELHDAIGSLWYEVCMKVEKRFDCFKDWMRKERYEKQIQEWMERLMKAIIKGEVDYGKFYSQFTGMKETRVRRYEITNRCTPREIEWLKGNVKEGHGISVYYIGRFPNMPWVNTEIKRDGSVKVRGVPRTSLKRFKYEINEEHHDRKLFFHVGDIIMNFANPLDKISRKTREMSDLLMSFKEELERREYNVTLKEMMDFGNENDKWNNEFFNKEGKKVFDREYFNRK